MIHRILVRAGQVVIIFGLDVVHPCPDSRNGMAADTLPCPGTESPKAGLHVWSLFAIAAPAARQQPVQDSPIKSRLKTGSAPSTPIMQ